MVQIPVQGIHLGRLGLRLESGVQNVYLPAAVEQRFLVALLSGLLVLLQLKRAQSRHKKGAMLKI